MFCMDHQPAQPWSSRGGQCTSCSAQTPAQSRYWQYAPYPCLHCSDNVALEWQSLKSCSLAAVRIKLNKQADEASEEGKEPGGDIEQGMLGHIPHHPTPVSTLIFCRQTHLRLPIVGSLISAAHLPQGRCRTPRYVLFLPLDTTSLAGTTAATLPSGTAAGCVGPTGWAAAAGCADTVGCVEAGVRVG